MFKNYLFLFRGIKELYDVLQESSIRDIYSQDKNKLYLHIPSAEKEFRHLILDTDSRYNFPLLKDEHHKAKSNVVSFWNDLLPAKISKIEIADCDRVIKITSDKFEMFFTVWGGLSNVYVVIDNRIDAFKKIKDDSIIDKITSFNYLSPLSPIPIEYDNYSPENLKDKIFFFRKDYIEEFIIRKRFNENGFDIVSKIMDETLHGKITISEIEPGKLKLHSSSFIYFEGLKHLKEFDLLNPAVQFYISESFKLKNRLSKRKEIGSFLKKELGRLSNRLNDLKARIDKGSNEDKYRKYADLLSANRNILKKGMAEISLTDFYSNEEIKIKLDPKLSAKQNIDRYYEKARDEKKRYEKSLELYKSNLAKYEKLIEKEKEFENLDDQELNDFYDEIFGRDKKMKNKPSDIKYRHYLAEGKYHIFVGRDNKNNDELTFKFAKQNDYWLHVRGYAGSHVVLRVDNPKEGMPKNIIKAAASLAAYHSKAKTAGMVPVIYTFRKYVRKGKGMAPGQVAVQRESSVIVPPEIPKNCEYLDE